MDHYIAEFTKLAAPCTVKDYCVFLEEKTGFNRFNPFLAQEQMVLYITNRGTFCVRVRGMGEFCPPEQPERLGLHAADKRIFCPAINKQYKFVRKWKGGCFDHYQSFIKEI